MSESKVFDIKSVTKEGKVAHKILNKFQSLSEVADISIGCQAYNSSKHSKEEIKGRVFHAKTKETEDHLLEVGGRQVSPYNISIDNNKWLKYGDWLHDYRSDEWLDGPRILVREITAKPPNRICAAHTSQKN